MILPPARACQAWRMHSETDPRLIATLRRQPRSKAERPASAVARPARVGACQVGRCRTKRSPAKTNLAGLRYPRQRPTLPRTYARSTIGGNRLNFRVRNGNGCDPAPMTTGKFTLIVKDQNENRDIC